MTDNGEEENIFVSSIRKSVIEHMGSSETEIIESMVRKISNLLAIAIREFKNTDDLTANLKKIIEGE